MLNRFGPEGLYFLDEPEAALSAQNCLTFLRRVDELVREGSQLVVATHSPIVLAYPDATIYGCDSDGVTRIAYDEAEAVRITKGFLETPERYLSRLFED
jgi:predicted ATPase